MSQDILENGFCEESTWWKAGETSSDEGPDSLDTLPRSTRSYAHRLATQLQEDLVPHGVVVDSLLDDVVGEDETPINALLTVKHVLDYLHKSTTV